MAKKAIVEVDEKSNKVIIESEAERAESIEKIVTYKKTQAEANTAMEEAILTGNLEAYQKAKIDRRKATDAIEMHEKRVEALNGSPLISKTDYEKCVAQIMTALGEVTADAKKKIIKHAEEIRVIAAECQEEIEYGNKVLHQLQHDVFRDDAMETLENGKKIHVNSREKRYENYSVIAFANHVLESGAYAHFSGQK